MATKTTFIPVPGLDHILGASELMHSEMAKAGAGIAAAAKGLVPKDTHATEESIDGGAVFEDGQWIARASAGTPYAPYVEFGTEDTPAQPFMGPALESGLRGAASGVISSDGA